MKETTCVAVVDGGMILTAAGPLVYEGVHPPRIGMPGGAWLRTVNQRLVQDKEIRYEERGVDQRGNVTCDAWVGDLHLNAHLKEQLERFLARPTPA